jgi:hypothetical protein
VNKIIGFTISQKEIDHSDVDLFNVGLTMKTIKHNNAIVYLWGIRSIDALETNANQYSLATKASANLLDRNVLITLHEHGIRIENDWLASVPVFYNANEKIISTLSLKTLGSGRKINADGLKYYLKYGYSVFGKTILEDIQFLNPYSALEFSGQGIKLEKKEDFTKEESQWEEKTEGALVLEKIQNYLNVELEKHNDEIIIPTSGGYDSRLLNDMVKEKSQIRSFTYGFSDNQAKSEDVQIAKHLSKKLKTQWEHISLKNPFEEMDSWYKIMGFSTHLHGMYHLQFLKKIRDNHRFRNGILLSGILGDGWSGKHRISALHSKEDIYALGLSKAFYADHDAMLLDSIHDHEQQFFEENKACLGNEKVLLIQSMRFKLILLSYLLTIPEYMGWPVITPFLNYNLIRDMLNIEKKQWQKREWQQSYFRKESIMLNDLKIPAQREMSLHYNSYLQHRFEKLNTSKLNSIIKEDYLNEINKNVLIKKPNKIARFVFNTYNALFLVRGVSFFMKKAGLKKVKYKDHRLVAPYLVIKTIEKAFS